MVISELRITLSCKDFSAKNLYTAVKARPFWNPRSPINIFCSYLKAFFSYKFRKEMESEKLKEEPPADVVELCRETFKKTSEYLKGELDGKVLFVSLLM